MTKRALKSSIVSRNKKAFFDYEMIQKYEAGIVLSGWEVKSIRAGNAQLKGSYISLKNNEAYANEINISGGQNIFSDDKKPRKLLLHKSEIKKLKKGIDSGGMTIIPTTLKISPKGIVKLDISLAKGKTKFDKRQLIKKREIDRKIKKYL